MGIFQQKPEEPTEWAGLPSDPWEPWSSFKVLPPPVAATDLPTTTGITIDVPLEVPAPHSDDAEA